MSQCDPCLHFGLCLRLLAFLSVLFYLHFVALPLLPTCISSFCVYSISGLSCVPHPSCPDSQMLLRQMHLPPPLQPGMSPNQLKPQQFSISLRSRGEPIHPHTDVYLVDTLGEWTHWVSGRTR